MPPTSPTPEDETRALTTLQLRELRERRRALLEKRIAIAVLLVLLLIGAHLAGAI